MLLDHPDVLELAVLGTPDETYGERVAALVVLKPAAVASGKYAPTPAAGAGGGAAAAASGQVDAGRVLAELRSFASGQLVHYKLPTVAKVVAEIPRNAMGKVNKKDLKKRWAALA